jgi:hypothetical protein
MMMCHVAACKHFRELYGVNVPHNIEAYWAVMQASVEKLVVVGPTGVPHQEMDASASGNGCSL